MSLGSTSALIGYSKFIPASIFCASGLTINSINLTAFSLFLAALVSAIPLIFTCVPRLS